MEERTEEEEYINETIIGPVPLHYENYRDRSIERPVHTTVTRSYSPVSHLEHTAVGSGGGQARHESFESIREHRETRKGLPRESPYYYGGRISDV